MQVGMQTICTLLGLNNQIFRPSWLKDLGTKPRLVPLYVTQQLESNDSLPYNPSFLNPMFLAETASQRYAYLEVLDLLDHSDPPPELPYIFFLSPSSFLSSSLLPHSSSFSLARSYLSPPGRSFYHIGS